MAGTTEKSVYIQKPFRCSAELDTRLNRAKGALMLQSGNRISDNQFFLELLELGLDEMMKRIDQARFPTEK